MEAVWRFEGGVRRVEGFEPEASKSPNGSRDSGHSRTV
jgi:hypothetical protein